MSIPTPAPRLRDQLLLLLLGTAWLCLLSIGLLSGAWLHYRLLEQTPEQLEAVAIRTEAAVLQFQARQRERIALLAARSDLRQLLLAAQQTEQQASTATTVHQLGELLGEAIGTVPSFRYALLRDSALRPLAASNPSLLEAAPAVDKLPDALAIQTVYQTDDGHFQHTVKLIWAGTTLGTLHVSESGADLRALFESNTEAVGPLRLRLLAGQDDTASLLAGAAPSSDRELQVSRRLPGGDWRLQVAIGRDDVLRPFYQWLVALLILALLLTVLLLLFGGYVAARFSRPLDLLAQYTSQWRVGSPWRARLPARSSAELQQLANNLAQMAQRENLGQKALTEALLETQQVEEQFRHLFENSPVACLLANQRGEIQLINPACASLFGYRVDELRGQSVELLMPVEARAEHAMRMAGFFAAPRERLLGVSRDLFGQRRDGVKLQIEIGVTPIRLGGEALALATINDLSTRKAYEQALLAMSRTDGLTGIANRRHFDQVLADEWRRLRRGKQGAAILMIDIDHFKALNDKHGHLIGDETLRMVGKALKQQLHRPGDFIARYGGEEFVVLLPATDRDGAMVLAEQMRQAIEQLPAVGGVDEHQGTPVSISVGVGHCRDCNEIEAAELLATADRQLYGAKRAGRNRVMA